MQQNTNYNHNKEIDHERPLKMFKTLILISCVALLLQLGHGARPLNPEAFDPAQCVQSVANASVCLTDFVTNFGRPSVACCNAIGKLDDVCIPSLFPPNPFIAPFLKGICSAIAGGAGAGGSGLPFPFPLPFPLPPIGGGSGGSGGGGLPFPFPFPIPTPGAGSGAVPPTSPKA